jgi:hypothetical protein
MRDETKAALVCSILLGAVALAFAFHHPVDWTWGSGSSSPRAGPLEDSLPPALFDQFLAVYGPPTSEEQSPLGVLHPPLFTKWLDYEPEHLRVVFVAAESTEVDSGKRWVLISFIDATYTEPVSAKEAARRLRSRHR